MKINALILAAGLGSRLKPLTDNCPKAMIKIGNYHLIEFALKKLASLPVARIVVNVHHHAQTIINFLNELKSENFELHISDERSQLMDTGGALIMARKYFDPGKPILVYNADVLTTANLQELLIFHDSHKGVASLMVQERKASRYLLFDEGNRLRGWYNPASGESKLTTGELIEYHKLGFNGIHIIDYDVLKLINNQGAFPVIPEYLRIAENHLVAGWKNWEGEWFDTGNPEKLEVATRAYLNAPPATQEKYF